MNRKFHFAIFLSIVTLSTTNNLNAQQNDYALLSNSSTNVLTNTDAVNAPVAINDKVQSSFADKFSNATEVSWSVKGNETFVFFKQHGVATRVLYDKKNRLRYTIKFYHGQQVPANLNDVMQRNGYDLTITDVTEIASRYSVTQFVKMENETSHITVRLLANGEVSVVESFEKNVE